MILSQEYLRMIPKNVEKNHKMHDRNYGKIIYLDADLILVRVRLRAKINHYLSLKTHGYSFTVLHFLPTAARKRPSQVCTNLSGTHKTEY